MSCADEVIGMPKPTYTAATSHAIITGSAATSTAPSTTTLLLKPSTMPTPTVEPPSKVAGVRVTPSVPNTSPTLTVAWQAVAGGAVTYYTLPSWQTELMLLTVMVEFIALSAWKWHGGDCLCSKLFFGLLSCAGPSNVSCVLLPPSKLKVVGVRVAPSVQNASPTLTVTWHAVTGGAVNYTVKYSTQPGEVNTPPEGALEVKGISGTSTILTALERGTTYYIWVVGVSEGREGPHSDRMSGVTYDSE